MRTELRAAPKPQRAPRWEITLDGENVWSDTDARGRSTPVTFPTEAAALAYLDTYLNDCAEDVAAGRLNDDGSDCNWRVREVGP